MFGEASDGSNKSVSSIFLWGREVEGCRVCGHGTHLTPHCPPKHATTISHILPASRVLLSVSCVQAELVPLPRHPNPVFTKQTRPARVRDTIMVKWANVQAKRDSLRLQQAEARQQQLQQL